MERIVMYTQAQAMALGVLATFGAVTVGALVVVGLVVFIAAVEDAKREPRL